MAFVFAASLAVGVAAARQPHAVEVGGAPCTSAHDCYLGGDCVNGTCVCDAWRASSNCSQLHLAPSRPGHVKVFPSHSNWSSWGAQVIRVDSKYHMYTARMANRCGLNSWWCNSEIVHAEADQPDGPFFTIDDPIVLPFAHNPAVAVASDGTIVIFHIGSGTTPTEKQGNCSSGISNANKTETKEWCGAQMESPPPLAAPPQMGTKWSTPNIVYSASGNPRGPWTLLKGNSSWGADNPAPIFLPNGTALLYAKFRCNETINPGAKAACYQYGLLRSNEGWRGEWRFVRMLEVFGEDVTAWQDQRGNFHMILQGGPYSGTSSPKLSSCKGHFHLADSSDGLEWTMRCDVAILPSAQSVVAIPLSNGSVVKLRRRERQFVFLGPDRAPLWWYNGVAGLDYDSDAGADRTYSSAQPFFQR